jgi:Ca2+-binding RTX toxin-like protein
MPRQAVVGWGLTGVACPLASDGRASARDNVDTTVENLIGGSSPDTLIGSALANRITGGLGADRLRGLGGDDTLVARDGVVDTEIQCDGGAPAGTADQATLDTADPTPSNCETVTR